jgi:multidrug efflux pump subunit AcrA (membrane-fusion protein)
VKEHRRLNTYEKLIETRNNLERQKQIAANGKPYKSSQVADLRDQIDDLESQIEIQKGDSERLAAEHSILQKRVREVFKRFKRQEIPEVDKTLRRDAETPEEAKRSVWDDYLEYGFATHYNVVP